MTSQTHPQEVPELVAALLGRADEIDVAADSTPAVYPASHTLANYLRRAAVALTKAAPPVEGDLREGSLVRVIDTGETGRVIRLAYVVQYDEDDGSQAPMGGSKGVCEYSREDIAALQLSRSTPGAGPSRGNSVLTSEQVAEIRAARSASSSREWGASKYARKFGVDRTTIERAARGDSWKSATTPVPVDASEALRDALVKAYADGAEEVHSFWKQCRPDVVFESEPDFTEAASDYARHAFDNLAALATPAPVAGNALDALKPFAEAAEDLDDTHNDRFDIWESSAAMSITAGDLRRAHKIYAALHGQSAGKPVGVEE